MSGQHARLSASSAHRWIACPGSVAPGGSASFAAAEGTFAHDIAAQCLKGNLNPGDFLLKEGVVEGHKIVCDLEMVEGVQQYLDCINEEAQVGDLGFTEMPLAKALQKVDPDLGGTADYVRYRPSTRGLRVFDFKYGKGVYVEVDGNEQMQNYALGAMLEVGLPVVDVEVTIVQPRYEGAKPIRSWTFPAHQIFDFIADVKEAADRTRLPNPPLKAGDHCTFCQKAAKCPELEKRQHALVAAEFGTQGEVVDYKALATALQSIPLVKERIKAIEEIAYAEACKGAQIPGFKLVDKVARRQWISQADVEMWAQESAVDCYAPREVLSPAQLEKKLGESAPRGKKKEAGKVLEQFITKVSSGTALVSVSDNRPPAKLITAADFEVQSQGAK